MPRRSAPLTGLLMLVLGLAVGAASGDDVAPTGRLRGEARTPDRRPVSGATVLAVRDDATPKDATELRRPVLALTSTDPAGFIAIDGIPAGNYRVVVTGQGYGPGRLDGVRVGGPFRSVVDLVMTPGDPRPEIQQVGEGDGPSRARVRVTGADGAPLAGVQLRLEPLGHRHDPVERLTDAEGETAIDGLGAGRWRLVVRKTGWTRLRVPVIDWQAGDATVYVRMLPQTGKEKIAAADMLPAPEFLPPAVELAEPPAPDPEPGPEAAPALDPDGTTGAPVDGDQSSRRRSGSTAK